MIEGYLILDKATSHMINKIINLLKNNNKGVSFVPPVLTQFSQPLNIAINKPFKQALKEKYIDFCIKNGNDNKKVSRNKKIDFIVSV